MPSHGPDERCVECSGPLETITVWRTRDALRVTAWTELCCTEPTCPAYDVAVRTGSDTGRGPGVS